MLGGDRYERAIAAFDAINAGDPNLESDGATREPKELLYARRMTEMLERFAPDASETVRLARPRPADPRRGRGASPPDTFRLPARCQHTRRWEIPRASYPATPEGYKAWRTRLLDYHAEISAAVLRNCGYDEAMAASVASVVRKERLKRNPDAQLLEDVIGLVFLQHYLADFVKGHPVYDEAKYVDILQKTFRKMSSRGRHAAATFITLPGELAAVVARAAVAAGAGSGPRPSCRKPESRRLA